MIRREWGESDVLAEGAGDRRADVGQGDRGRGRSGLVPVLTLPGLHFIADCVPVCSLASIPQQEQRPRLGPGSSADRKRAMATGTPIGRVGAGSGLAAAAVRVWPQ